MKNETKLILKIGEISQERDKIKNKIIVEIEKIIIFIKENIDYDINEEVLFKLQIMKKEFK